MIGFRGKYNPQSRGHSTFDLPEGSLDAAVQRSSIVTCGQERGSFVNRAWSIDKIGAAAALSASRAHGSEARKTLKIVGVVCSPREGQTTAASISVCLEAAKEFTTVAAWAGINWQLPARFVLITLVSSTELDKAQRPIDPRSFQTRIDGNSFCHTEMRAVNDRHNIHSRWRPRLSLRAILLLPLIAGIYFACGRMTKSRGAREVTQHLAKTDDRPEFGTHFVAPFLYQNNSIVDSDREPHQETTRRTYYVWFFGFIAKLPFATHQNRPITVAVEDEFEETYFPIRSGGRTAVPVQDWRMQHEDLRLLRGR